MNQPTAFSAKPRNAPCAIGLFKMSLDLRTGRPVWRLKRIAGHRKLAKDIRCEVAVVDGGVSGVLIAHRLVNSGRQEIIVDSRDVGMGSTMASTAILSYEPHVHLIDLISQIGSLESWS